MCVGGAVTVKLGAACASSVFCWAALRLPRLRAGAASADTLKLALTQAYQNNPQLNAQRAALRATDETVPQALSGYRPRVSLTATAGEQYLDSTMPRRSPPRRV